MNPTSQNAELATTIEQFVKNRRAPGTSLQLAIAFSEDKWAQIVAALRAQQSGPSSRAAVLEEALEQYAMRPGYDGEIARIALKNAAPQVAPSAGTHSGEDLQPASAASEAGADDARDAARYRWLRDSGLAVAAWQDVGAVHWALNGVEYLSLDEGVDEQIKRQSATEGVTK